MTSGPSLKLLAGIAIVLTTTLSIRAVEIDQPRTPILIPNIQEPEEMRVAPFRTRNTVPTPADGYEGRADAYMQTREWDLAIKDLTAAISHQIGGNVFGNVSQFRAIYPEYGAASDDAIAQKLNQTFYPDIKYEDFSVLFLTACLQH